MRTAHQVRRSPEKRVESGWTWKRWVVFGLAVILFSTGFTFKTWRGQLAHGNREMEKGQYDAAIAAYQEGLVNAPEEPRVHYNLGNALYAKGDFVQAGEHFKKASGLGANTDLQLQAEYNLGNALYQQGAAIEEDRPEEALQQYESALHHYKNVIQTHQQDLDAKYNYELVRKKIDDLKEKLKDQQKQQQDQQDQDQQSQDSQNQDQQSKQDTDQGSKQDESQKNADQNQSNQSQPDDPQHGQQQSQGNQQQEQSDPTASQQNTSQPGADGSNQQADQSMVSGESAQGMTKEQALQLLEQFEGQGGQWIPVMPSQEESSHSRRDW